MTRFTNYVLTAITFALVILAVWRTHFITKNEPTSGTLTPSELVIGSGSAPKTYTLPDLSAAFHKTENSFFDLGAQIGAECGMLYALGKETGVQECIARKKNQEFAEIDKVGSPEAR